MPFQFNIVSIIGIGLIGGSLAGAIKEKGLAQEVRGYDENHEAVNKAVERNLIDSCPGALKEAVREAEVVILAVPVGSLTELGKSILPHLSSGTVITDVGSVKAPFVRGLETFLPENISLVGGHPIAGTENSGVEAAFPELFVHAKCILTPTEKTHSRAIEKISRLWEGLEVEVILMTPEEHDRSLARISHLPHIVAYSLVNTIREVAQKDKQVLSFPAGGFKDFTRVASSHPVMWRDISLANRNNILEAIDYFQEHLKRIRDFIKREEGKALEKEFVLSREFRAVLKSSEKSKRKKGFIIAIDGPASAGKSTISKAISQALNYTYISTGAIYRAVALKARQENIAWDDQESLAEVCSSLELQFKTDGQHGVHVYLDGENITSKIKDEEIGKGASAVSAFAGVRKALLGIQRNLGKDGGVVMDGRDIGTVIFPNAEVKFYLDATVEARANRRYKELKEAGLNADITAIEQSLRKRDSDDSSRDLAPLSKAPDAIYLDTTKLSIENVKEIMLKEIKGRLF